MVVGEDECAVRALFQFSYLRHPFLQLFFTVGVVVTFPGLVVLPPLLSVATVEASITYRTRGFGYGGKEASQTRLIDTAEAEVVLSQELEGLFRNPLAAPELYDDGKTVQLLA
jgi:hypothetical protein